MKTIFLLLFLTSSCLADGFLNGNAFFSGNGFLGGTVVVGGGGGGPTTRPGYATSGSGTAGNVTTCTAGMTVQSGGANRVMIAWVCQGSGSGNGGVKTITSVEWRTTTVTNVLTLIPGAVATDGNFNHISGYYFIAPFEFTAGNVVATFAAAPTMSAVLVNAYTNGAQSSTFGTAVTASQTTSTTVSLTATTGTGQMSIAAACTDANTILTIGGTASPTQRIDSGSVSGDQWDASGDAISSGTITWSWTGNDNGGAIITVPFNGI